MDPRPRSMLAFLLLFVHLWPTVLTDFTVMCPQPCECRWQSGDKSADCSTKNLNQVPQKLSDEIQNLNLSGNPLYELSHSAFQNAGLSNLKKLLLKMCNIISIHRHAFSNLKIMIELDVSFNDIKILYPETFSDTEKIRVIHLNNNHLEKIEDGLFKNLPHLQKIDLSYNHIFKIGLKSFARVPLLKIVRLAFNNLTHMKLESISSLNVTSLDLHNNPWKCDCTMQSFRNWVIDHKLYTPPTKCVEPPRLLDRLWSDTESGDFACKPTILHPFQTDITQSTGDNVTLSCKVYGNPIPTVNWVQNSRVIDGDPKKFGDHRLSIKHSEEELTRWVNLTISQIRYHDRGEYTCKAENPGGIDEKTLSLGVNKNPGGGGGTIGASDIMTMIIGITVGAILLMILISILCFCFCKRRDNKRHMKSDMHSSNGEALIEGSLVPEIEKNLITTVNPVTKPPRIYDAPSSIMSGATEMSELNKNLLDGDSFVPNEDERRSMDYADQHVKRSREALLGDHSSMGPASSTPPRPSPRTYPPDLLSFPPRAAQASPASSTSTAPDTIRLPNQIHSPIHSPIYGTNPNLFRTLPYSRSQSPFTSPVGPPVVTPRQGYVTIPRRPRVPSWSSTASAVTPGLQTEFAEPVYDNLGLRTSANGSSALSLNKAGLDRPFSPMRNRPLPATPVSYQESVMYTPIEEHERAPSPAPSTPYNSTLPRMSANSLRLHLSPTTAEPQEPVPRRQRSTPETGFLKRFTPIESYDRQSPAPSLTNGSIYDIGAGKDTLGRSGKIPPRPPPKPKKKSPTESAGPLFEDEGEDGTEV